MARFKYSARDKDGKEVKSNIEARDSAAVADILHDRGLIVVSIKEVGALDFSRLQEINIGGVPMKEKVVFMRQMATMIAAGLPLNRALEIMVEQATNPKFKKYLKMFQILFNLVSHYLLLLKNKKMFLIILH